MSRAYTIRVSESIRRHVRVSDGVQTRLEVIHVLSAEEMAELIEAELVAIGFERDEQGNEQGEVRLVRVDQDGVEISVDPKTATLTVRAEADREVEKTIERTARVEEEVLEKGRVALRERTQKELEGHIDKQRDQLTAELADKLERKLADLRLELDGAATRATANALKIRAAQIGEVQRVSENEETGELTIVVKV